MFTAKTVIKSLAATVLVASAIAPSMAGQKAASTRSSYTINCTVPNAVVCTISSPKGIKSVNFKGGPVGENPFNLVNKSYEGCPKEVKVSWDSAYQSPKALRFVTECSGVIGNLKAN